MNALGYLYATDNDKGNDIWAIRLFTKAADRGHAHAQNNLGVMYDNGLGVREDDREAAERFLEASNQGVIEAHVNLGNMYITDNDAENDSEARSLFEIGAEHGNIQAQNNLGAMLVSEGIDILCRAAKQGHAGARKNLALINVRNLSDCD